MIGRFQLSEICERLSGVLKGEEATFSTVSIDTRTLQQGALFVAIKGPNFDGHRFVSEAESKGAVALLVSEEVSSDLPRVMVTDTRVALGQIGALNRERFKGGVLAVTGSAGKTTVKEMAATILRGKGEVLATRANFNNEIGVPLTLLEIADNHQFAVMELGASSIGEIEYTVTLVQPDVAIITNAVGAHIEGFGSLDNVVQAKGEIIDGLKASGLAVINGDDLNAYKWMQRAANKKTCTFSLKPEVGANFTATAIEAVDKGKFRFELKTPLGDSSVQLSQLGRHNIANALAAAAGAMSLGASLEQVKKGLEESQPVAGRLITKSGISGCRVLDDSYNANPESLRAAIDVLVQFQGRRILVLGDMAELGDNAFRNHQESGRYARTAGVDALYTAGPLSAHAAKEFGDGGEAFNNKEALIANLSAILDNNTTVLVKGSRSAQMEQVVRVLTGGEE